MTNKNTRQTNKKSATEVDIHAAAWIGWEKLQLVFADNRRNRYIPQLFIYHRAFIRFAMPALVCIVKPDHHSRQPNLSVGIYLDIDLVDSYERLLSPRPFSMTFCHSIGFRSFASVPRGIFISFVCCIEMGECVFMWKARGMSHTQWAQLFNCPSNEDLY